MDGFRLFIYILLVLGCLMTSVIFFAGTNKEDIDGRTGNKIPNKNRYINVVLGFTFLLIVVILVFSGIIFSYRGIILLICDKKKIFDLEFESILREYFDSGLESEKKND